MQSDIDLLTRACEPGRMPRRVFLGALGALAVAPRSFAQAGPPIPVTAINHMTINVSDPARSLEWYQGLFGMPIAARQANTVILRVGAGPQFLAIGGGASDNPHINHLCLYPRLRFRGHPGDPGESRRTPSGRRAVAGPRPDA